jgi:hypothetical protein
MGPLKTYGIKGKKKEEQLADKCMTFARTVGKKRVSPSLCPSVRLSAHPHVSSLIPLDGFTLNLALNTYIKHCRQNPNLVLKTEQNYGNFSSRPTNIYTADSDIFISTIQREIKVTFLPRQLLRERATMSRCAFLWTLKKYGIQSPTNLHQRKAFTCSVLLLKFSVATERYVPAVIVPVYDLSPLCPLSHERRLYVRRVCNTLTFKNRASYI